MKGGKKVEEKNLAKIGKMKCPKCGYIWRLRTENPKSCPYCKYRLWKKGDK